jgi:hypothetical protein
MPTSNLPEDVTELAARTPPRRLRARLLIAVLLLLAAIVALALLPVPSPLQMRAWAQSVGTAAPLLFLLGHTLVTVAPFARTVFTLTAGLLFGPVLGVALSLLATMLSAVLAFGLVRRLARGPIPPLPGRYRGRRAWLGSGGGAGRRTHRDHLAGIARGLAGWRGARGNRTDRRGTLPRLGHPAGADTVRGLR